MFVRLFSGGGNSTFSHGRHQSEGQKRNERETCRGVPATLRTGGALFPFSVDPFGGDKKGKWVLRQARCCRPGVLPCSVDRTGVVVVEPLLFVAKQAGREYEVRYHDAVRYRLRRDEAIRAALAGGHTVREVAEAMRMSVGRVHAISRGEVVRAD